GHSFLDLQVNSTTGNMTGQFYVRNSQTGQLQLSGLISGWPIGMAGMKPGETRVMVLPSDLGYGTQGSGQSIPPNSTLIFVVTARKSVVNQFVGNRAAAQMLGNLYLATGTGGILGSGIGFNEKTPSVADGTFIGAITANSTVNQFTQFFAVQPNDLLYPGILPLPLPNLPP